MTDWADDIASDIVDDISYEDDRPKKERPIAAALRKAKADGIRWAADMQSSGPFCINTKEQFYEWADKIEKGQA